MLNEDGKCSTVESLDVAKEFTSDLELIKKMYEKNKYDAAIDKVYRFEEIVEAHRYVDTGHKKSNVVVAVI